MTPSPSFDASIPVLTEVLKDEPAHDGPAQDEAAQHQRERAAAPAAATASAAAPADPAARLEAAAVSDWSEAQWALLEHRLSDRILHQLQGRVDFVLEQRVKDSMEAVVNGALHELTREIRSGLHDTIQKIVARAVAQELTHLQAQKK